VKYTGGDETSRAPFKIATLNGCGMLEYFLAHRNDVTNTYYRLEQRLGESTRTVFQSLCTDNKLREEFMQSPSKAVDKLIREHERK